MPTASPPSIQNLLEANELLIVPGDAAARQLRHRHDLAQQQLGRSTWQPANVLTWDQWLRSLWSNCVLSGLDDRLLMNSLQEHSLWLEVVRAGGSDTLAPPDSLAGLAASAWRLSEAYGATDSLRKFAVTHDARVFADWAEGFRGLCRTEGYIARAGLEQVVERHIRTGSLAPDSSIHFADFPEWTPAQRALITAVREAGAIVTEAQIAVDPHQEKNHSILLAEDEASELRAVAQWIRNFIRERTTKGQSAHVALLVPDLESAADSLRSTLLHVLAPELETVDADLTCLPFDLPEPGFLHSHPLIAAALDLARWVLAPLPKENVSALLLSPYLTPEAALEAAAIFDAVRHARLLRPEIELPWLVRALRNAGSAAREISWPRSLHRFLESAGNLDSLRSFAQWAEFLRQLIRAAGWPGTLPQTWIEFSVARAWDHALDNLATLDFAGKRTTYSDALSTLERQVSLTPFPAASGLAPVQVLRPAEVHGVSFDALAVIRATDANWPGTERTNSLIGWQLQAALGMPGARGEAAASARRKMETEALLDKASHVLFSFAKATADGSQRLSPSIAELNLNQVSTETLLADSEPPCRVALEIIRDSQQIPKLPDGMIRGGAAVLQHQAACGFRAFAEIRLRAQELQSSHTGLDARQRGDLLHRVMSGFWSEVQTHKCLDDMSPGVRREMLDRHVHHAFSSQADSGSDWDAAYLGVQKQRLTKLLNRWLQTELERNEFTVVATEIKQEVRIEPLTLQVRVDRIDQVGDSVVLVDYKTGRKANAANWEGERPDEPQLPLYALLQQPGKLAGIAFAQVRPGKPMGWHGIAAKEGVLPGKNPVRDLSALVEEWRVQLGLLANAFASGDAGVRPKSYPSTCSTCSHRPLCRLVPATLLDEEDIESVAETEDAFE